MSFFRKLTIKKNLFLRLYDPEGMKNEAKTRRKGIKFFKLRFTALAILVISNSLATHQIEASN